MPEHVAIQATALRQASGGGGAVDELIRLVTDLGSGLKARVDAVEDAQKDHREEVEQRLNRYEQVQERVADRVVSSVERLARLETIPDRLSGVETQMHNMNRAHRAEAAALRQMIKAVSDRVDVLELDRTAEVAEEGGRRQARSDLLETVKFSLDYGWKIAAVVIAAVLGGQQAGWLPRGPSTIQQPTPEQVQLSDPNDWTLRTN